MHKAFHKAFRKPFNNPFMPPWAGGSVIPMRSSNLFFSSMTDTDGVSIKRGPDIDLSYVGDNYHPDTGVNIGSNPPIGEKGLSLCPAYTEKLKNSQCSEMVANGSTPPTVTQNHSHLGQDCTKAVFTSSMSPGYAGSRMEGLGSSTFLLESGKVFQCGLHIALSRPLVSGEEIVFYYTGSYGGLTTVINTTNSTDFVGKYVRLISKVTPAVAGTDWPVIFLSGAVSSDLEVYACKGSATENYVFPFIKTEGSEISSPSHAATSGGNGAEIEMDEGMLEAFRGEPDGVELTSVSQSITLADVTVSGTDATHTVTDVAGGIRYQSDTTSPVLNVDIPVNMVAGERYLIVPSIDVASGGLKISNVLDVNTSVAYEVGNTPSVVYVSSDITYARAQRRTSNTDVTINSVSIQKLQPATLTLAALVTMGVGSGELANNTKIPLITTKDKVISDLFMEVNASGVAVLGESTDEGGNYPFVLGSWDRNAVILVGIKTNKEDEPNPGDQANTKYRAIAYRVGVDTAMQEGSWANFDGSLNPETHFRIGYNNTIPLFAKMLGAWKTTVDNAALIKEASKRA